MQTNFDEIRGFSKKFRSERYFGDISPHFRDAYCVESRENSNDNSLCTVSRRELSSDNSLSLIIRCELSSDFSACWSLCLLQNVLWESRE